MNPVLNTIPVKTWKWLKVNDTYYQGEFPNYCPYTIDPLIQVPQEITVTPLVSADINSLEVTDQEYQTFVRENRNHGYFIQVPDNTEVKTPLIIDYILTETTPILIEETVVLLGENSTLDMVVRYHGDAANAFHSGITYIEVADNAHLHLSHIQMLHHKAGNIDYIHINQQQNSNTETIVVELGAEQTYGNWHANLWGQESYAGLQSVYVGEEKERLDFNYRVNHHGENSRSHIGGNGVLLDQSHKVFRDTIDFQKGSKGSKASEEENVLLLTNEAVNFSVPLLLCVEDDVEGAHAATVGSFDDKILFYLMSRGISKQQAKKLLIEAVLVPTIHKIPDSHMVEDALSFLHKKEVFL